MLNCVHNLLVKVQEIAHKYLKIIYVDEIVKMALFDISKTLNAKMGCFWYNGVHDGHIFYNGCGCSDLRYRLSAGNRNI